MRNALTLVAILLFSLPAHATEPNPSLRQRELIGKLMELTNTDSMLGSVMDAMFGEIHAIFMREAEARGNTPEQLAEAKELFDAFRERAAKIEFGELLEEGYVRVYAKYFTEAELEDLIAFHSTPTGRKSIEVMPDLMREGMQLGAQQLGPRIDEVMAEVKKDQEKKRPWRRTMSDMRWVATALEMYALDHDDLYPAVDYAGLKELLVPEYLPHLPESDVWEHPYSYAVSPDRTRFRLVSAGADSIFDWDSRTIPSEIDASQETRYRNQRENDIIYGDGFFVQAPVQTRPETPQEQ